MLERRTDLALLSDLRVAPAVRGRGVGAALFGAAERWAAAHGAAGLKVETQTVNVPTCRFGPSPVCVPRPAARGAAPMVQGTARPRGCRLTAR